MTSDDWQSLRSLFADGHRQLASGLQGMIDEIERGEYESAGSLAKELDRSSGPHIEFEERYLYPVVEQEFGEAYATKLYDEHVEVIATLIELQQLNHKSRPTRETQTRWLNDLREGLEHLNTSQSLVHYLRKLSSEQKSQLLHRHQNLRERGHRWSQLHPYARNR